jgi:hypothetical protein
MLQSEDSSGVFEDPPMIAPTGSAVAAERLYLGIR